MVKLTRRAHKHGITLEQCHQVMSDPQRMAWEIEPSIGGNKRALIVGYAFTRLLVEIAIEFLPKADVEIYHANKA